MNLNKIMDDISPLWGICPFSEIKSSLISCRAMGRLPQNAESVIVACFPYLLNQADYENLNISKYAVVPDYHAVATARLEKAILRLKELFPDHSFSAFADNSPIPEVRAACLAGLGVRGANSLLITPKYGSYVFIGEIVTDLKLDCKIHEEISCIKCGRCTDACPSNAINKNGFERDLCLSEITQKKKELSDEEIRLMKNCGCVWGCDICQDVCPMNKKASVTEIEEFLSAPISHVAEDFTLENRAYEWRGRKVIERNLSIQRRDNT